MKTVILLFSLVLGNLSAWAQPSSDVISRAPNTSNAESNQLGVANLNFTNRSGASYSADQLAARLQNLRKAVDQTLPALTAFNETFPSATNQSIAGTISGILSGALNRNSEQNAGDIRSKHFGTDKSAGRV